MKLNLKKTLKYGALGLGIILGSSQIIGCDSKVVEESPGTVQFKGESADQKNELKQNMDTKMNSIDMALTRVRNVTNLARMYKDGSVLKTVRPRQLTNKSTGKIEKLTYDSEYFLNYTFLDLILDINAELKEEFPQRNGRDIVRTTKIRINSEKLGEDCKDLDVILTSSEAKSEDNQSIIGENLTYAVKTCGTTGEILPIFNISYRNANKSFSFKIMSENTNKILKAALIKSSFANEGQCDIDFDGNNISKFFCSKILINLGESKSLSSDPIYADGVPVSESILLNHVSFSNSGETKVEIRGNIYELHPILGSTETNQESEMIRHKGTLSLKMDQNDRIKEFNLQKVDSDLKFDLSKGNYVN